MTSDRHLRSVWGASPRYLVDVRERNNSMIMIAERTDAGVPKPTLKTQHVPAVLVALCLTLSLISSRSFRTRSQNSGSSARIVSSWPRVRTKSPGHNYYYCHALKGWKLVLAISSSFKLELLINRISIGWMTVVPGATNRVQLTEWN